MFTKKEKYMLTRYHLLLEHIQIEKYTSDILE